MKNRLYKLKSYGYPVGILLLLQMLFLNLNCKKDGVVHASLSQNETIPQLISNITIDNGKGTAILHYTVPADPNLYYVKAVYETKKGVQRVVKASYYENQLILDGFADTLEHTVEIFSVNRAEKASKPIEVKVRPLISPIWEVYNSLKVSPDFGGINIKALNDEKADVAIQLLTRQKGNWALYSGIYTSTDSIDNSIRGLDTNAIQVAVYVRDKYQNTTDTLFTEISPLYEALLDKSKFSRTNLPGEPTYDFYNQNSKGLTSLWDGKTRGDAWPDVVWTSSNSIEAQHVTIDIGVATKLSRMVIFEYSENATPSSNGLRNYFYGGNLRKFEVWGATEPASDGSFNGWDLLGSYEVKKPSGLPYGYLTQDDFNQAAAGFNCTFHSGDKKYRYLRINSLQNWLGTTYMTLVETNVYGDPRN